MYDNILMNGTKDFLFIVKIRRQGINDKINRSLSRRVFDSKRWIYASTMYLFVLKSALKNR